jgi:WD40 repeat protein
LASSTESGVRLWDLRQPKAPPLGLRRGIVSSVAFSRDGTRLASGGSDATVVVWDLWTRAADRICTLVWRNLSMEEWRLYVGGRVSYQRTCPNLPAGIGAPVGK